MYIIQKNCLDGLPKKYNLFNHYVLLLILACIARKVGKAEWQRDKDAKAAMDKEWSKLENLKRPDPNDKGKGCWDLSGVRGAESVQAEA